MTKGELLKELEDLDDDAVIYVTGCTCNRQINRRGHSKRSNACVRIGA